MISFPLLNSTVASAGRETRSWCVLREVSSSVQTPPQPTYSRDSSRPWETPLHAPPAGPCTLSGEQILHGQIVAWSHCKKWPWSFIWFKCPIWGKVNNIPWTLQISSFKFDLFLLKVSTNFLWTLLCVGRKYLLSNYFRPSSTVLAVTVGAMIAGAAWRLWY